MIDAAFAAITVVAKISTPFGNQLDQIGKLVANNATVQANKQLFFRIGSARRLAFL